jgi:hypothetical protein
MVVPSPTADSAKKGKFAWKSQRNDEVVSKVIKSDQGAPSFDPNAMPSGFSQPIIPNRLTMDSRPTHKSTDDLPSLMKVLSAPGPSKFGSRSKIIVY